MNRRMRASESRCIDGRSGEYQIFGNLSNGLFDGIPLTLRKYLSLQGKKYEGAHEKEKGKKGDTLGILGAARFPGTKGASRFREITVYYLFKIYRIAGRAR